MAGRGNSEPVYNGELTFQYSGQGEPSPEIIGIMQPGEFYLDSLTGDYYQAE